MNSARQAARQGESPTGEVFGTASLPLSAPAARRALQRPAQPLAALEACRLRVFALVMLCLYN